MAHVISDECVSCGACAATCPVTAISEGADKYVVDPKALTNMWLIPLFASIAALAKMYALPAQLSPNNQAK